MTRARCKELLPLMSGIEDLRRLNALLGTLLENPHPGLAAWNRVLSETLTQMSDYAGHGRMSQFPELLKASKTARTAIQKVASVTDETRLGWALKALDAVITKAEGEP